MVLDAWETQLNLYRYLVDHSYFLSLSLHVHYLCMHHLHDVYSPDIFLLTNASVKCEILSYSNMWSAYNDILQVYLILLKNSSVNISRNHQNPDLAFSKLTQILEIVILMWVMYCVWASLCMCLTFRVSPVSYFILPNIWFLLNFRISICLQMDMMILRALTMVSQMILSTKSSVFNLNRSYFHSLVFTSFFAASRHRFSPFHAKVQASWMALNRAWIKKLPWTIFPPRWIFENGLVYSPCLMFNS